MNETGIGASLRRKEDRRFITGKGNYTDDINRPGQTHAVFIRSPHAHAAIKRIDSSKAIAGGAIAVLTGTDVAHDGVNGLPCGWQVHSKDGSPMQEPVHPVLAMGAARHVGDPVAMVIAETKNQAKDLAELVEIDYEILPAAIRTADADKPHAPQVHEGVPSNQCYDWELGDLEATNAAFAKAAHVTKIDIVNNRLVANAIEPRSAIGEYESSTGQHTLYTTSQNPHVIRLLMGAFVLGLPEHKLRVVAPDVGGGFGSKIFHYQEEAAVTWAAKRIGRPIKWTAERSESFISDAQGRDHVTHAELALDADGNFMGFKISTIANMGAYLSTFAPAVPTYLYGTLLAGLYKTPAIYCEVKAVFTNTVRVDAYRGAGRPEACYLIESIVDKAARELGRDPAELRLQNVVTSDQMPYQTPVALEYDSGDFGQNIKDALKVADYAGFETRRKASEAKGMLRGIGLSSYIEACGIAPSTVAGALGARAGLYESGEVRVHPTGSVTVMTGSHSHGQGHETTFAQIVSERLGVPAENVEIVHGDTDKVPFGMGTYGSRSLSVGGMAIMKSLDKIVAKSKKIAAHILEASEADIEFTDGTFRVAGTDKELGFGDVALQAYVPHNYPHDELEPGLNETSFYDPANFTFPNGCHVCEVEIDPETGVTRIERFVAVDDFGNVVNPMIVEGQVHGGLVQGIGQALCEDCIYDDSGQLVTGSYMDYCMPKADMVPSFEVGTNVVPCTHNALGVKGCGEAGTIGATAAVMNAIRHALRPLGVHDMELPATPKRVWAAIRSASPAEAAE
jgi:aerobic carbon-monoxide dehydrogenase large subunit